MDTNQGSISPQEKNRLVERVFRALQKEYMFVGNTRVRSWQAWLLIGISAGIVMGISLVSSRSGNVEP